MFFNFCWPQKENNPDEYALLEATNLKKGHLEPLAQEVARKMEQESGRGTVKVKQEKKKDPGKILFYCCMF